MAIAEFTRILPNQLAHRLGVDNNVAQGLLKRLEKEGYIMVPNKGKRSELIFSY
jgi:ribosomal protein S25